MTFEASETSLTAGEPVELYKFAQGTNVWRFTSGDRAITFDAGDGDGPQQYLPEAIDRGNPDQTSGGKVDQLVLTTRRNFPIALLFRVFVPSSALSVTIFKAHRTDLSQFIVFWKGLVRSVAWEGNFARITADTLDSPLKADGLRFQFQVMCNHMLFGPGCGLSTGPFIRSGTISAIDGDKITSTAFTLEALGWYAGGVAEVGGDRRLIVAELGGGQVQLLLPFEDVSLGQTVNALPGCNRFTTDCSAKFGNLVNYGGFPGIPKDNPYSVGLEGQGTTGFAV